MGQLEDLRVYVAIVETAGISRAADRLRIAKSAVSRRLNLLEERYGARLIDRDPGTWQVTATGRDLYQRAIRVVTDADEIEAEFVHSAQSLSGPLAISVANEFGRAFLQPALLGFARRHPEIRMTVDFDDRRMDLERENYDFAIRIAADADADADAEHVDLRLGRSRHRLYASPAYAAANPLPETLTDLAAHPLLHFGPARRATWDLYEGANPRSISFQPALNANSGLFLLGATLAGIGIARLPDFIAETARSEGRLVHVLPQVKVPDRDISLIHAANRRLNRRMRIFAAEMRTACAAL